MNDWVWSNINFLVGSQEPLLANVRGWKHMRCSGMSHTTTAFPKPSLRAPWRVGDTVVGRGNVGWTTSNSGHPCPCQNCSQGPPAEKARRGSAKLSLVSPWQPSRSMDWTVWCRSLLQVAVDYFLLYVLPKMCVCVVIPLSHLPPPSCKKVRECVWVFFFPLGGWGWFW